MFGFLFHMGNPQQKDFKRQGILRQGEPKEFFSTWQNTKEREGGGGYDVRTPRGAQYRLKG